MQYSVLQLDLAPPSVDALQQAFARTKSLSPADAPRIARESLGIIAQHMDVFEARDLVAALGKAGVPAQAIAEDQLPQLAPSPLVRRLDCLQAGLTSYDSLGRQTLVDWSQVVMVAAGLVTLTDQVPQTPRYFQIEGTDNYAQVRCNSRYAEKSRPHLLLEVILQGAERYRADGNRLTYDYLGPRRHPAAAANFALLVRDLLLFAPTAMTNLGACAIRDGSEFLYSGRKAFETEIVWHLWKQTT
jgi:hypothetical protein